MFKIFQNNTALTAEVLNDYLMEQGVITFATASERDNAIPTPNPGMHVHLLSTKRTYYYDSGWIELLPATVSGLTARTTLVCTSTTRPAHAAGRFIFETDTKRSSVSDGAAWRVLGDIPVFASLANRNTYYGGGQAVGTQCLCLKTVMTWDGSTWRFTLHGSVSATTDGAGMFSIAHGAGQAPLATPVVGPGSQSTESQNAVVKPLVLSSDATNINVKIYRTDTSAVLAGNAGVSVAWIAQF